MPRLSVLITYHNEGMLLTRCLSSFAGQKVDEILICDDASSMLPKQFILPNIPVRVLRNEKNLGPAKSRNRLLREAASEFVHFHDADDWVTPDWAERVCEKLSQGFDVVFTEVSSFRQGKLVAKEVQNLKALGPDPLGFALNHFLLVPSGTYRKSTLEKLGGYPEDLWQSEDYYFHVSLLRMHPNIGCIFDPLVGIDLRSQGRSQNTAEVWSSTLLALKRLSQELPERAQEICELAFQAGSILYQNGATSTAKEAFRFSFSLGRPNLSKRNWFFRILARRHPVFAEKVGLAYRALIRPLRPNV